MLFKRFMLKLYDCVGVYYKCGLKTKSEQCESFLHNWNVNYVKIQFNFVYPVNILYSLYLFAE
jgi:hypothetical protein